MSNLERRLIEYVFVGGTASILLGASAVIWLLWPR